MHKVITTSSWVSSGKGTPMYSRRGQSTIAHYIWFSSKANKRKKFKPDISFGGYKPRDKKKKNIKLINIREIIDSLEKKKEGAYDDDEFKQTPNKNSVRLRRRSGSKIVLNLNDKNPNVPPLGHYKPVYDFVKPRITSTCFHKGSERKSVFDKSNSSSKTRKNSMMRLFSLKHAKHVKLRRPQTGMLSRKRYLSVAASPGPSYTRHTSFLHDVDPRTEYNNCRGLKSSFAKVRSSVSRSGKRCSSASKQSQIFSTRVGSSNTTYTNFNVNESVWSLFH
jgi:hypothetical protein